MDSSSTTEKKQSDRSIVSDKELLLTVMEGGNCLRRKMLDDLMVEGTEEEIKRLTEDRLR